MKDTKNTKEVCCICGGPLDDKYGHNPAPVKYEGRCCDTCHVGVLMARVLLEKATMEDNDEQDTNK